MNTIIVIFLVLGLAVFMSLVSGYRPDWRKWISSSRAKHEAERAQWRAELMSAHDVHNRERSRLHEQHDRELEKASKEADDFVAKYVRVIPQHDFEAGYAVAFQLDRQMLHEIARHGDRGEWDFMTERVAKQLRQTLATMNLAGFNQLALEASRENERKARHEPIYFRGPTR